MNQADSSFILHPYQGAPLMRSLLRSILGIAAAEDDPSNSPPAAADVVAHVPGLT
jgi:hypothetical protein